MSVNSVFLKIACNEIIDIPLKTIVSKEKSLLSKIVAGIAIAVFSVLSLGFYVVHTYRFFADRKVGNLQKELEQSIEENNLTKVQELFTKHPQLKTREDLRFGVSETCPSRLLPLAAEKGNLKIVQLLRQNGAKLDSFSRGNKTALERALDGDHGDVARYLIDEGATLTSDDLGRYILKSSNFDMILFLVEKQENMSSEGKVNSNLAMVALKYSKDSKKCAKILHLLVKKGDRLKDDEQTKFNLSEEAMRAIFDAQRLLAFEAVDQ